jgi:hypothetical protein
MSNTTAATPTRMSAMSCRPASLTRAWKTMLVIVAEAIDPM